MLDTSRKIVTVAAGAEQLVNEIRPVALESRFVTLARSGRLTHANVQQLVRVEYGVLENVIIPLLTLAARFRHDPAGPYFLQVLAAVNDDRANLRAAASALGLAEDELPGRSLDAIAYAYPGYICWLSLHGGQAATALLAYTDFTLWHEACVRLTGPLRDAGMPAAVTGYFAAYEQMPEELRAASLVVAQDGIDRGEDLGEAVATAGLLKGYLQMFWEAAGS